VLLSLGEILIAAIALTCVCILTEIIDCPAKKELLEIATVKQLVKMACISQVGYCCWIAVGRGSVFDNSEDEGF
jgi:hypothetical protein